MVNNHLHYREWTAFQPVIVIGYLLIISIYIFAAVKSNQRLRQWPLHRSVFWILGVSCVFFVVGPLAPRAHIDFTLHMIGHLLLGMLAPLFIVLSAPMTLLLRTLSVQKARFLSKLLQTRLSRFLVDPAVSALLNFGGLWILYTTSLYLAMQQNMLIHVVIHFHVFVAGFLFTTSMISIDSFVYKTSFLYRAIVLVIALGSHSILSKYIYAYPLTGVSVYESEIGGKLMFYGGDVVDIILIYLFCLQWYNATSPKLPIASVNKVVTEY
ncbi:cytochrome c oxidase assembly protein [Salipaludibacillus sp. CF4.18]|uniref:cytochrome c oxidase assembly protein n=1 Tax=Salipaludibacillus sp. CF4.18 TaxID=3373081 RepID=UPI003EE4ACF7